MKNTINATASMKDFEPIRVIYLNAKIETVTTLRRFLEICDACTKCNTHLQTMPNGVWTNHDFFECVDYGEDDVPVKKGFFARLFNR